MTLWLINETKTRRKSEGNEVYGNGNEVTAPVVAMVVTGVVVVVRDMVVVGWEVGMVRGVPCIHHQ